MQFEERTLHALAALSRPRDIFESALLDAIEELTAFIGLQREPVDRRAAQESLRLGEFAAGHIDIDRFSAIVGNGASSLDSTRIDRLEHALQQLRNYAAQHDGMYCIRVQPGVDLRDSVRGGIAARGRIFNTAHQVQMLRTGGSGRGVGDASGFRSWSRLEKSIAPPLIVEVNGADLQVSGLAEYMDGAQKIVLLVDGGAAPAPLVRLLAPRTFVMQTTDVAELSRLGRYDGPGIAAVLPETCARFCHDPSQGESLAHRLDVTFMPEMPRRGVAGGSARQQAEELAWLIELAQLARTPRTAAAEPAAAHDVSPADQLAAWLLNQVDAQP